MQARFHINVKLQGRLSNIALALSYFHSHPSGNTVPHDSDIALNTTRKDASVFIGIRKSQPPHGR